MHPEEKALIHNKANGDAAAEKRLTAAACYRVECWAQYSPNSPEWLANYVSPVDARDLGPELKWVDSQKVAGGRFDYSISERFSDSLSSQFDQASRGARRVGQDAVALAQDPRRAFGQVVGQMRDDALAKASERPEDLIARSVANGLNALLGMGGARPPTVSPGAVLMQGATGAELAGGVGTPAKLPDNVMASGGDKNRLPIPDVAKGENGLQVESNPKYTPGMGGNRPNAGVEPKNSPDLFNSSVSGGDGVRYAIDESGNINRFSSNGNGVYHWSGSTGDASASLNVSKIPIEIKRSLGFKGGKCYSETLIHLLYGLIKLIHGQMRDLKTGVLGTSWGGSLFFL
ncbi:hypothetical protein [Pandoraea communis]|uniref:hypothetical protein n=1 Tax=Pandoraea communis TaxID=2508297 RepID=UPI001FE7E506|nr:hypothetical protein [Pandoraea communis]